jgi:hypothetical protein
MEDTSSPPLTEEEIDRINKLLAEASEQAKEEQE